LNLTHRHDNYHPKGGELCMKGGIYSDERCLICEAKFNDIGNALSCSNHPKSRATRFVVRFGNVTKRFKSYDAAQRFLTGVRFKTDEATFDERDYRKDNPLSFSNLSEKWLKYKIDELRPRSYQAIKNHIRHAQGFFGNMNVKDIRYGHLEDFLKSIKGLSEKTKHNILSTVHSMYEWLKLREEIRDIPKFPTVSFELGYRRTVSKDQQLQILEEVKRICPNPKVYIGIKWLATYISIRPGELVKLKEGDIDLANRYLYFPHPKEKKYKSVPILQEDVQILRSFSQSVPGLPFFRHDISVSGATLNEHFGQRYLYKWWVQACKNLEIEGVYLYGGTRHSSARALRAYRTPEEIKRATMHTTNKAFERYFNIEADDLRNIYKDTAKVIRLDKIDNGLITKK
jgi:integrase